MSGQIIGWKPMLHSKQAGRLRNLGKIPTHF
jgi:hypothetical protein